MVKLTDEEIQNLRDLWGIRNKKEVTAKALERVFTVYPWTTRLFSKFNGNFSANGAGVQGHADKVLKALDKAVDNINNLDDNLARLSTKHQEIGVDTQNFELLGQTFIVELAIQLKTSFNPELHKIVYRFFKQLSEGLSSQYQ